MSEARSSGQSQSLARVGRGCSDNAKGGIFPLGNAQERAKQSAMCSERTIGRAEHIAVCVANGRTVRQASEQGGDVITPLRPSFPDDK